MNQFWVFSREFKKYLGTHSGLVAVISQHFETHRRKNRHR